MRPVPQSAALLLFCIHTRAITWRHLRAPAGVAAPQSRNQLGGEDCLSEASSAAHAIGTGAKAPLRATPGRPWFWVLLPKQKDLAVRGRNPARTFLLPLSSSTLVIEDPVSLFLVFVGPPLMRPTESAMRWRRYIKGGNCTRAISSRHFPAPAGEAAPRSRTLYGWRGLSERSEFRSPNAIGTGAKAPPWGHARAPMVLGPFAETKGPRRAGPKPRIAPPRRAGPKPRKDLSPRRAGPKPRKHSSPE